MHYLIIVNYGRSGQNKLSFLSTCIYGMTHSIPYYRSHLPLINQSWRVTFKQ